MGITSGPLNELKTTTNKQLSTQPHWHDLKVRWTEPPRNHRVPVTVPWMCRLTGSVTAVTCARSRRCTLSTGGQEPASPRRSRSSLRASCPTELSRLSQQMLPPLLPREPLAGAEEIKPFSSVPCASGSSLPVSQRAPAAFRAGCPPGLLNQVWKYAPPPRSVFTHKLSMRPWLKRDDKRGWLAHIFVVMKPSAVHSVTKAILGDARNSS